MSYIGVSLSSTGEKIAVISMNYFQDNTNLFLSTDTGSTWRQITNLPSLQVWRDVSLSSDGTQIVICSYNYICRSTDFGSSWTNIRTGSDNWRFSTLSDNGQKIAVCNNYGVVYSSMDYGTSSQLTRIPITQTNVNYKGAAISYDGTKIGVIADNLLYISTNTGNSWTKSTISMVNCFDMNASYDFSMLIACPSSGIVITSTNSGLNWFSQTTLGSKNWSGSCVSGDGNVIGLCESSGYIWISNDRGVSWNQRAVSESWRFIQSSYDGKILIVGKNIDKIWRSTDYGVNWGPIVNSPKAIVSGGFNGNWVGICMSSDGKNITVSFNTSYPSALYNYKSVDSGTTWMALYMPGINNGFSSNEDKNKLSGSADGQQIVTERTNSLFLVSGNGGYDWVSRTDTYTNNRPASLVSGDGSTLITIQNLVYISTKSSNIGIDIRTYYEKI
jgi:hypothetical protein